MWIVHHGQFCYAWAKLWILNLTPRIQKWRRAMTRRVLYVIPQLTLYKMFSSKLIIIFAFKFLDLTLKKSHFNVYYPPTNFHYFNASVSTLVQHKQRSLGQTQNTPDKMGESYHSHTPWKMTTQVLNEKIYLYQM